MPPIPPCPKCGSRPSDIQEGQYHCMKCGTYYPVNGVQTPIINQLTGRDRMEKSASGKKGTCINCERKKFIADKEGLCGACHNAVAGLEKGTAAYTDALATVKARVSDPNFKCGGKRKTKPTNKNPEYEKYVYQCRERGDVPLSYLDWSNKPLKPTRRSVRKVKALAPVKGKPTVSKRKFKSAVMPTASDFQKQDGLNGAFLYRRIEEMTLDRDFHLAVAARLTKAIEILQA